MTPDIVSYGYALIVFAGGVIGYLKAGSMMSLGSGIAFGAALGYGAYRLSVDPKDVLISLVVSGLLAGMMGYRFINTRKVMPAGVVTVLSVGQVIRLALRLR